MFVPADDRDSLRGAIQSLIDDEILREEMSRRSYERAQTFTAPRTTRDYLDLYRAVTATRKAVCAS